MQNWPNWCHYRTSSLIKVASEFLATNVPDPLYWTQTHVLGRFGPFRSCMKIDVILTEQVPLMHKFAKEGLVRIFCNERTRSTPLDAKLMFWGVSDRFVTARKSLQNWPNSRH
jgi:hypothetical protein